MSPGQQNALSSNEGAAMDVVRTARFAADAVIVPRPLLADAA
jgi:hypothetical protein